MLRLRYRFVDARDEFPRRACGRTTARAALSFACVAASCTPTEPLRRGGDLRPRRDVATSPLPAARSGSSGGTDPATPVRVGTRPHLLVEDMDDGLLKMELERCADGPFRRSDFSIAHRGAPLKYPEHTREAYEAAAEMGAGLIECDVTFTKDRKLVCRHAQCDLHATTDILARPDLARRCTRPFVGADPVAGTTASATCCTTDVTLAEFKSLCGTMESADPHATTTAEYMGVTGALDGDRGDRCGTLLSHQESIDVIARLGAKFIPELKAPSVTMPFEGTYTDEMYARQLVAEYEAAGIPPRDVFPQSFRWKDVLYWLKNEPRFAAQVVYLDDRVDAPGGYDAAVRSIADIAAQGLAIVAPPMWALVTLDAQGRIVPSTYARVARAAGLDIVTWTLERSGSLAMGGGYYFQSVRAAIDNDGDTFAMLDALAVRVGVRGVFSDWPATVTYYASCKGL